jgi:hypothetical protein
VTQESRAVFPGTKPTYSYEEPIGTCQLGGGSKIPIIESAHGRCGVTFFNQLLMMDIYTYIYLRERELQLLSLVVASNKVVHKMPKKVPYGFRRGTTRRSPPVLCLNYEHFFSY